MKITNKYNLPQALVDLVSNSQFGYKDKCYSATTIINPTRYILLNKRHDEEIESDVSDMMNMVLGTSVHSMIEKFDKTGYAELFLKQEIKDGYYLTGKCDLYDEKNYTLVDYKTATVSKIQMQDFEDWRLQGLIYSWMLINSGKPVSRLKFHAILKDWTPKAKRQSNGDYPETQVYTWEYPVLTNDLQFIKNYIENKFDELIKSEKLRDDELIDCGEKDTWYTGDKYAVYKNASDKKAARVLDNEQEAHDYITNKLNGVGIIQFRKGEYRRCQDYCNCCKFCKYYKERKVE